MNVIEDILIIQRNYIFTKTNRLNSIGNELVNKTTTLCDNKIDKDYIKLSLSLCKEFLVLIHNRNIIGILIFQICNNSRDCPIVKKFLDGDEKMVAGDINHEVAGKFLYVDIICAKKTFGRYVMELIEDYAIINNCDYIKLSSLPYVMDFYKKLGFNSYYDDCYKNMPAEEICLDEHNGCTLTKCMKNKNSSNKNFQREKSKFVMALKTSRPKRVASTKKKIARL
jgi:hypothetical protein